MKIFRLLAASLLAAVCAGFSSCGGDELESVPTEIFDPTGGNELEKIYSKYIDNYEDITCKSFVKYNNDTIAFTGITPKGYLMIDLFRNSSETKVFEWIDNTKTDTIYNVHKGYGEYEEVRIRSIEPSFIKFHTEYGKDFIAMLHLNGSQPLRRVLFVNGGQSHMTDVLPEGVATFIPNWYNNQYCFIHDCCYTLAGDTVYTIKYGENDMNNINNYADRIATGGYHFLEYQRISPKEAIGAGIDTGYDNRYRIEMVRINYKTAQNVWGEQRYIALPFDYEAKAKLAYSVTDKSSNIWTYKVSITYYDGTKSEVTLKVDIESGTVQGDDDYIASLIIGKWKMTSGDAVATHVTYKGDGTFEYTSTEDSSYKEVGKYKIDGNKLYEMYSDEDEWIISDILLLNSMFLSVQELEADGVTPNGKKFAYQRVE